MEDQFGNPVVEQPPPAAPTPKVVLANPTPAPPRDVPSLIGKTVERVVTERKGSMLLIDFTCADDVHCFIKVAHNQAEVGGTAEWGTGVIQL